MITEKIEIFANELIELNGAASDPVIAFSYLVTNEPRTSFVKFDQGAMNFQLLNTIVQTKGQIRILTTDTYQGFYGIAGVSNDQISLTHYSYDSSTQRFNEASSYNSIQLRENIDNYTFQGTRALIYLYSTRDVDIGSGRTQKFGYLEFLNIQGGNIFETKIPIDIKAFDVPSTTKLLYFKIGNPSYLAFIDERAISYFELCSDLSCYSCKNDKNSCDSCNSNNEKYDIVTTSCNNKNSYNESTNCEQSCILCTSDIGSCLVCNETDYHIMINGVCRSCADMKTVPELAAKEGCSRFKNVVIEEQERSTFQQQKQEMSFLVSFENLISKEKFEFLKSKINLTLTFGVIIAEEDIKDLSIFDYRNFRIPIDFPYFDKPNQQIYSRVLEEVSFNKNEVKKNNF